MDSQHFEACLHATNVKYILYNHAINIDNHIINILFIRVLHYLYYDNVHVQSYMYMYCTYPSHDVGEV